jgi:hypothetical protein
MPQHAVSASPGPFQNLNAADRQGDASPDAPHDVHTFSPPLAGNDVSAFDEALDHRISEAAAPAASHDIETLQDGNNDNIPSARALVILDSSTAIAAAGPSARTNMGRAVTILGLLTVLGLGAAAFSYNGLSEPKNISAPQQQLASVAPSVTETNTIAPVPSAETNPASTVAPVLPSEAASVSAATAPTRSVLPPAPVPEEKLALVTPEPAPRPSAALPESTPTRVAAEPPSIPAQEATSAAAVAPQIAPNNQPPATAAQPAPSVTPPPPSPGRGQFVFVQRPNVNIRNAPTDRSPIIGVAQFGGRFVVARSDGEWVQVAHGPWRGWINSRFLGSRLPRG